LATIINKFITWVLLLVGALAVLFIVWGGLQYITSSGNKDKAEQAKQTLTYAVIGLIVIVLAKVIVNLVTGTAATAIF
jgi:flagellar basal body-associated protein FliL